MFVRGSQGIHNHQRIVYTERIVPFGKHLGAFIVGTAHHHAHQSVMQEKLIAWFLSQMSCQDMLTLVLLLPFQFETVCFQWFRANLNTEQHILGRVSHKRVVLPQVKHHIFVTAHFQGKHMFCYLIIYLFHHSIHFGLQSYE